jgi:hypothetical protein
MSFCFTTVNSKQKPFQNFYGQLIEKRPILSKPSHTAEWDTLFSHIYLLER